MFYIFICSRQRLFIRMNYIIQDLPQFESKFPLISIWEFAKCILYSTFVENSIPDASQLILFQNYGLIFTFSTIGYQESHSESVYTFFNISSSEKSENRVRTTVGFFTFNLWLNEIWESMSTSPPPGTSLIFEILSGKFFVIVKKLFMQYSFAKNNYSYNEWYVSSSNNKQKVDNL